MKVKLEFEYRRELENYRAILTLSTIGILAFFGTFIWFPERWFYGFITISVLGAILYYSHTSTKEKLQQIIDESEK